MQTHYVRPQKRPGFSTKLASAIEGLIVQAIPMDRLVTAAEAKTLVEATCKREGERPPATLIPLLEGLAKQGHLVEIHGSRLVRLIEGIK